MKLISLTPRKSLNKAYLKVKPHRSEMEAFKTNLKRLMDQSNDTESEEFHKNLVADFLKNTYYYPSHFINTKGRNDQVIHNGKDASSTVGVIIEAKKPTNKAEMITSENLNRKAFHELMLYYLRERVTQKNLEIKYIVATNISEWFVFDAHVFEKNFAENKKLVKQFEDFEAQRLAGKTTDFFYKEVAAPFIDQLGGKIEFTHFDLRDYEKPLRSDSPKGKASEHKLIALYKLLSPEHLLKLPFANDSNSLDKKFYSELLHIIGLTEVKQKGKKVIERHAPEDRHTGALLENAVIQLDTLDKISRLEKPGQYGATHEDRLFNVGLELAITWVNRILFLKLLEAQLISYHKGDASFAFLNFQTIKNFDDLNALFFEVLSKKHHERNNDVKEAFAKVPYLNSSLFELNELEHTTILISNLRDEKKLPIHSATVLKDDKGKKRKGELNALEYLFAFLEAYDFSSEGAQDIQEDNKTLINASVLGLIFEKINGYKDGSFFTPGFITMYMCRETIRRSVVQKFKDAGYQLSDNTSLDESFDELYDKIEDRNEANAIINSLKICDPAVGSGHFLVSALNEVIAIKNDLKVLQDREGKRLKEYTFEVVNDELVVADDDGDLFEYTIGNKEAQRVQETLFHEKQTIIENCLFGVDINPNSVKICRLRLWIELLKNAYYTDKTYKVSENLINFNTLETLPNIDINIKCGNSLISRFPLDADIKEALKKSKWTIDSYRMAVDNYRNAKSKEEKHEMQRLINDIKSDFRMEITKNDPLKKRLRAHEGDLFNLTRQTQIFGMSKKEKREFDDSVAFHNKKIKELETKIAEIENAKIYENAFEWRFEFPEVLNEEGDFVGFDTVIGNPPYLRVRDISKDFLLRHYTVSENQLDLYHLFIEKSFQVLTPNGFNSLIVPNAFLANQNTSKLRRFILSEFGIISIVDVRDDVFEEASVDVLIYLFSKGNFTATSQNHIGQNLNIKFHNEFSQESFKLNRGFNFSTTLSVKENTIVQKIESHSQDIEIRYDCSSGIKEYQVGKGKPAQTQDQVKEKVFNSNNKIDASYLPELRGKNLKKYDFLWNNEYISYGVWLAEPRDEKYSKGSRLLIRQIPGKHSLIVSYVEEDFVIDQTVYVLKPKKHEMNLNHDLAILNSKLIFWYFRNLNNEFDDLFPKIKAGEIKKLPSSINEDETIAEKVTEILTLKKENPEADTSALEAEIDQLVYQLYELTDEEIEIVENSVK